MYQTPFFVEQMRLRKENLGEANRFFREQINIWMSGAGEEFYERFVFLCLVLVLLCFVLFYFIFN